MATEIAAAGGRRKPRENQFSEPGKMGRKTGITIAERPRDPEHGLESLEDIFSPDKVVEPATNGNSRSAAGPSRSTDATLMSDDMVVGNSTIPEPTETLTARKAGRLQVPLPRSKSPMKTSLLSPARRDRSLGLQSSPVRGDIVTPALATKSRPVKRTLDFSKDEGSSDSIRGSPQKRVPRSIGKGSAKLTNGARLSPGISLPPAQAEEPSLGELLQDEQVEAQEDSYQIQYDESVEVLPDQGIESMVDDEQEEQLRDVSEDPRRESEDSNEPEPEQVKRKRGRPASTNTASATAVKRGAGREPKRQNAETVSGEPAAKRPRGRPPKSQGEASKSASGPAAKKARRPRESLGDEPSIIVHRGPPMPRRGKGLVSIAMRHETPDDNVATTRSGRNVFKPLKFWVGETTEHGLQEIHDGKKSVWLPTVTSVIRADEIPQERVKRAPYARKKRAMSNRPKKDESENENEDLVEPWEAEPGRIYGDIRSWDPEDPLGLESQEREEEIALSSAAIITRDIPGSTFKFAKTLTLPFFGSGMVDLQPGAIKKPKNSRKMQMVFFVFAGRVSVTVNENTFRIGKGGMWQVPRGNFYSIENDYEQPARIFFAQGCEVLQEELVGTQ